MKTPTEEQTVGRGADLVETLRAERDALRAALEELRGPLAEAGLPTWGGAALAEELGRLAREAAAYRATAVRLDEAHVYAKIHLMPGAWGKNVWHALLDDAVALRAESTIAKPGRP